MKQENGNLAQKFSQLASRVVQKISNAFKPLAETTKTVRHSFAREATGACQALANIITPAPAPQLAVATVSAPKANTLGM
jgi:hypothetical protein